MKFARLGVIAGAVAALGPAAHALAESYPPAFITPEKCAKVQTRLDEVAKLLNEKEPDVPLPTIVVFVKDDEPNPLIAACLTGGLEATPCDPQKDNCPPLGTKADGIASFYRGNSPGTGCWYPPLGGGAGCDQISPRP